MARRDFEVPFLRDHRRRNFWRESLTSFSSEETPRRSLLAEDKEVAEDTESAVATDASVAAGATFGTEATSATGATIPIGANSATKASIANETTVAKIASGVAGKRRWLQRDYLAGDWPNIEGETFSVKASFSRLYFIVSVGQLEKIPW